MDANIQDVFLTDTNLMWTVNSRLIWIRIFRRLKMVW